MASVQTSAAKTHPVECVTVLVDHQPNFSWVVCGIGVRKIMVGLAQGLDVAWHNLWRVLGQSGNLSLNYKGHQYKLLVRLHCDVTDSHAWSGDRLFRKMQA